MQKTATIPRKQGVLCTLYTPTYCPVLLETHKPVLHACRRESKASTTAHNNFQAHRQALPESVTVINPGRWRAQSTSPAEATCPAQEAREGCGASAATGCGHYPWCVCVCVCCRRCIRHLQPNAVSLDGLPLGLYTCRLNLTMPPMHSLSACLLPAAEKGVPSHTEAAARASYALHGEWRCCYTTH